MTLEEITAEINRLMERLNYRQLELVLDIVRLLLK